MPHKHSITDNPQELAGVAALAAAVGAFMALLFAPRNGWQTRQAIRRRAKLMKNDVQDHLHKAEDAVSEVAEDARSSAVDSVSEAKTTADKVVSTAAKSAKKATPTRRTTARRRTPPTA